MTLHLVFIRFFLKIIYHCRSTREKTFIVYHKNPLLFSPSTLVYLLLKVLNLIMEFVHQSCLVLFPSPVHLCTLQVPSPTESFILLSPVFRCPLHSSSTPLFSCPGSIFKKHHVFGFLIIILCEEVNRKNCMKLNIRSLK